MNRKLKFSIMAIVLATTIAFGETNFVSLVSTNISITPTNLAQLLALPPDQLEKIDTARIDLLCAEDLRGSEDLDVEQCLKTLDALAQHVKEETERNRHYFIENPARFKYDEGYFRMMYLATVLQEDFGVQYDPERKNDFVDENGKSVRKQSDDVIFSDSKDHFINGLLTGKHYGTCASLPMLYVAVGQRLGYPVHFATTQAHGYVRYEEGTNHFNVEATCIGFKTYPDAFYKNWPFPLTDEYIKQAHDLESLDNKMVLGHCLAMRATCLTSMKKYDEAAKVWNEAMRYLPDNPLMKKFFESAKFEREKSQWLSWWSDVDNLEIPQGRKFSYFQNLKVRVQMFMSYSDDMDAIGKVVASLKNQVAEYQHEMKFPDLHGDSRFVITWPENFNDLPDFPSDTVSMPSLAASPDYWRAIPPELIQKFQLTAADDADVIAAMVQLENQPQQQNAEQQMDTYLPPQVRQVMQMEKMMSQSSPPNSPITSPQLIETLTRLADNPQFITDLSQYHTEKLQQLMEETAGGQRNNSLPQIPGMPTVPDPTPNFPEPSGMPGNQMGMPGLPPQVQQAMAMANAASPNSGFDGLRQMQIEQGKIYHLQSIAALATKVVPVNRAP